MKIKKVSLPDFQLSIDRTLLDILQGIAKDQERFDTDCMKIDPDLLGCMERFTIRTEGTLICKDGKQWMLFNGICFVDCPLWVVVWFIEHILSKGLIREAELMGGGREKIKAFAKKLGVEVPAKATTRQSLELFDKHFKELLKSQLSDQTTFFELHEEFIGLRDGVSGSVSRKQAAAKCRDGALFNSLLKQLPLARGIYRQIEELNADGFLLVCKDGITLDLRHIEDLTKLARPSTPQDLNTQCVNAVYDPQAVCPVFQAQFEHVIDNPEVHDFFRMQFGTALDGSRNKEIMAMITGAPGSGKSVLLNALAGCLGDYAARVSGNFFLSNTNRGKGDATPHLVQIIGKRLVIASEPDGNAPLDEGLIKTITGEPSINYRAMYDGRERQFKPVCTMVMSTNKLPRLSGNDAAITSRRLAIHHKRGSLPLEQMKNTVDFAHELELENSGILNFLLDGYRIGQTFARIPIPACMQADLNDYQHEYDALARFFEETGIEHDPFSQKHGATVDALYSAFTKWSEEEKDKYTLSKSAFGSKLKSKGYSQARVGKACTRHWLGIHLPTPSQKAASNGHSNGHTPTKLSEALVNDTADLTSESF